jgi:hypothetical protein
MLKTTVLVKAKKNVVLEAYFLSSHNSAYPSPKPHHFAAIKFEEMQASEGIFKSFFLEVLHWRQ